MGFSISTSVFVDAAYETYNGRIYLSVGDEFVALKIKQAEALVEDLTLAISQAKAAKKEVK